MKNKIFGGVVVLFLIGLILGGMQYIDWAIDRAIDEKPEKIIASLEKWQKEKMAQAQKKNADSFRSVAKGLDLPTKGAANASVIVYEFMDYNCGYCKRFYKTLKTTLSKTPDVQVQYVDLPILGKNSTLAAQVALASRFQGKYMIVHDAFMTYQGRLNSEAIFELAKNAGVNIKQLKKDMQDDRVKGTIQRNLSIGQMLGISGTPYNIIMGKNSSEVIAGYTSAQQLLEKIQKHKAKSSDKSIENDKSKKKD